MSDGSSKNNQEYHTTYPDDEIDLMELFSVLWRGKWLITGMVFISALAALIVLKFFTVPYYKIDVVVDKPSSYQVQSMQPSSFAGGEQYQLEKIDMDILYSRVLAQANSSYVKRLFWGKGGGSESLPASSSNESRLADSAEFKKFTKRLSVAGPDIKNPDDSVGHISLEYADPVAGVEKLEAFVSFINTFTINRLADQLRSGYETLIAKIEGDYQSLLVKEQQKIEDELVVLTEAMELAESLGIKDTPYELVENVELKILDDRLYLLGARVLKGEINALKARQQKPIASFVKRLRDMENWKKQLQFDLKQLDENVEKVSAFTIVTPPESSLEPVKPNKLLILVGVIFLSGMLGVIIVFIRHAMKNYQARDQG